MKGMKHSYVLVALLVLGAAVYFVGVGGYVALLIWPIACVGVMVAMMWSMRGMDKPSRHTHSDGITHSHAEDLTRSRR